LLEQNIFLGLISKERFHVFHSPSTTRFYCLTVKITPYIHHSPIFWRSIPSLQTLLAAGMGLLMLEIVMAHQPARAERCKVDPFGSEVCLPDPTPEEPDQPDKPKPVRSTKELK
jgi:hypothetical protein